MEFPFGHHHHHHHKGEEEEEEGRRGEPQYPPPGHQPYPPDPYRSRDVEEYQRPAPTHYGREEKGYYGDNIFQRPPPPPTSHPPGYDSGPGYTPVQHVAHEVSPGPYPSSAYGRQEAEGGSHVGGGSHHGHHGGPFSFIHHVSHESSGGGVPANLRTVRVFTKADENYSLSIRDGKVVLVRTNPNDDYQHWLKDEKFSTKVKDEEGLPSFALVNKVTGEAIKHSVGATHPVRLVPYKPDYLDQSVLWTESYDTGEGFRCVRMVNNIRLNFDAFHGDKDHGGVRDGTIVVLWEWLKGENQRWKIVSYCKLSSSPQLPK